MQYSQGLSVHVISTSSCAGVLHFWKYCKYLGFKNVFTNLTKFMETVMNQVLKSLNNAQVYAI